VITRDHFLTVLCRGVQNRLVHLPLRENLHAVSRNQIAHIAAQGIGPDLGLRRIQVHVEQSLLISPLGLLCRQHSNVIRPRGSAVCTASVACHAALSYSASARPRSVLAVNSFSVGFSSPRTGTVARPAITIDVVSTPAKRPTRLVNVSLQQPACTAAH